MKKISILTLFFGLFATMLFTTSCEKVKDLTAFDVQLQTPEHQFILDSAALLTKSGLTETLLTHQHVTVNLDSILNASGISSATITNGGISNVTIAIVAPLGSNFNWLSSARVMAAATLEELPTGTLLAHTGTIAPGSVSMTLIPDNAAMTTFINNNNFYIGVYGTLLGPLPASQLTLSLNSLITFTVNPLGE